MLDAKNLKLVRGQHEGWKVVLLKSNDFIIYLYVFSQAGLHGALPEIFANLLHLVTRWRQLKEREYFDYDGLRKIGDVCKHAFQLVHDFHPFVSYVDLFALFEKRLKLQSTLMLLLECLLELKELHDLIGPAQGVRNCRFVEHKFFGLRLSGQMPHMGNVRTFWWFWKLLEG